MENSPSSESDIEKAQPSNASCSSGVKEAEPALLEGPPSAIQRKESKQEVVLFAQVITARHHKLIQVLSVLLTLAGLLAFAFSLTFKLTPQEILFRKPIVQRLNIGFASLNVSLLAVVLILFTVNTIRVNAAGLKWTRRKRIIASIAFAQLVTQFINTVFFLFPNVHGEAKRCSWFHKLQFICATVRQTCWNTYFLLMAIHTHNLCPWLDKDGKFRRAKVAKNSRGIKGPLIIMDAAFWLHLPKFLFWCMFQFCIIFLAVNDDYDYKIKSKGGKVGKRKIPCELRAYECIPGLEYKIISALWVLFIVLYVCMIQTYILQARRRLLLARYNEFLQVHLMVLTQRKQVWYITVIGVVITPVLWFTRWERCGNYFVVWLGLLPLQVIVTAVACMNAYYFMPIPPGSDSIQQEWLRKFVWTEAEYKEGKRIRGAEHEKEVQEQLAKEPMFCFETAVKLALWSEIVYTYGIVSTPNKSQTDQTDIRCPCMPRLPSKKSLGSSGSHSGHVVVPLESKRSIGGSANLYPSPSQEKIASLTQAELMKTAMSMYDLQESEVIAENLLQTRALLGWSGSSLVIAFRGTATVANVLSDAKAWRIPHPPKRGTWILGQQPMVHKGFLQTWTVNGFNKRILKRILEIYDQRTVPAEEFTIRLTGHSLGSSLSQLCALELMRINQFKNVFVYGYGSPRIGNHAFCREIDSLVPEIWQLNNDRDAVPRAAKGFVLYKHAGQRVLLNQVGDIRVRPSMLELSIHKSGYSIKQHFIASYVSSLFSICMAQCMPYKCEPGGREGVEELAQSDEVQAYFATLGLDLRGALSGEAEILMPSLKRKQSRAFRWWGDSCLEPIFSALENFVPGLEEDSPLRSIFSVHAASDAAQQAIQEENRKGAPEHLLNRVIARPSSSEMGEQYHQAQKSGLRFA